jgi:hypothetical protein
LPVENLIVDNGQHIGNNQVVSNEDRVRDWPFVSLNMRPEDLAALTELAKSAGKSRAELMREVLVHFCGPYVKALSSQRDAA